MVDTHETGTPPARTEPPPRIHNYPSADGVLDARTGAEVGVDAFLLDVYSAHRQGHALVDRGAVAGIATITDVLDRAASALGQHVARPPDQASRWLGRSTSSQTTNLPDTAT